MQVPRRGAPVDASLCRMARMSTPDASPPCSTRRRYRLPAEAVTDYESSCSTWRNASWNAGAKRSKGYQAVEVLGQHFSRLQHDEDRKCGMPARAVIAVSDREVLKGELVSARTETGLAHAAIDAIRDPDGHVVAFANIRVRIHLAAGLVEISAEATGAAPAPRRGTNR